ncbi:MAG: hypothetical protein ACKN9A_12490, partial [Microcystis aeruginosa]
LGTTALSHVSPQRTSPPAGAANDCILWPTTTKIKSQGDFFPKPTFWQRFFNTLQRWFSF